MSETSQTIRQKVHALAEDLPPDASWQGVIGEARFHRAIDVGLAAADRAAFAKEKGVRSALPNG